MAFWVLDWFLVAIGWGVDSYCPVNVVEESGLLSLVCLDGRWIGEGAPFVLAFALDNTRLYIADLER